MSQSVQQDGKVTTEFFSSPEFTRAGAQWRRVTGAVRRRGAGVETVSASIPAQFGAAGTNLVTLDLGSDSVSMRLEGARAVKPSVVAGGGDHRAGKIGYPEVMPDVDLEYEVLGAAVKERLVLASAAAPRKFTFRIDDAQHALGDVTALPGGAFAFTGRTADGMAVGLSAPSAWSSGEAATALPGDQSAWQKVTKTRTGYRVDIGLDEDWAAAATYPVVLDPTLTYSWVGGTLASAWGRSWWDYYQVEDPDGWASDCADLADCAAQFSSDGSMFVANTRYSSPGYAGHVRVDLSTIPWWTQITSATLRVQPDNDAMNTGWYAWPATAPFTAGDPVPRPDGQDPDSTALPLQPTDEEGDAIEADVTSAVQAFVEDEVGERAGITIGGGCQFSSCETRSSPNRSGTARKSVESDPIGGWLSDPSLVIEYEGGVLPPPLPVDQTFGCPCGEWGTGADATGQSADPISTGLGQPLEVAVDAPLNASDHILPWGRIYNGADSTDGTLGTGWTHPYNASLSESTDSGATTAAFRDPTGGVWRWTRNGDGTYQPWSGVTAKLVSTSGGGWTVTSLSGRSITFDDAGRELSDLDAHGDGVALSYALGRLSTLTDAEGATTTLTYGTTGPDDDRIVSVELPGSRSVSYAYENVDDQVRLASVDDLADETTTYDYDDDGNLAGITDPDGNTRAINTYDEGGRILTQGEPTSTPQEPHTWDFDWSPADTGTYPDGSGLLIVTDPDGIEERHYYSGNVLFRSVDNARAATTYTYDSSANLVAITDPLGRVTTMTYDARGNLLSLTSPAPESITETWTYNNANQITTFINGEGETTTTTYSGGRPATITDPLGGVTQLEYDQNGRLTETTTPGGRTTQMTYDSAGNLASQTAPGGGTTTWTYDSAGNTLTETTPRGNTTGYTYDSAGRVLTQTDPAGTITSFVYTAAGRTRQTTVTDPDDNVLSDSSFTYNAAGRTITASSFDRTVLTNSYSPAGRVRESVDAGDRTTYYDYDATGRQVGRSGPGPDTWQEFDKAGQLAYSYGGNLGTMFEYDSAGRIVARTTADSTTTTTYDDAGRVTAVTDPGGGTTNSTYDDNGRLTAHALPGQQPTTYAYVADGNQISQTSPSGLSTTSWTYTPDGAVATRTAPRGNAPGATPAHHTTSYGYDADGNQTTVTDPVGETWTTTYDGLGQQTEVEDPLGRTTTSEYDRLGQLLAVTAPDDTTTTHAYDRYGNQTSRTDARGNTTTNTYDDLGRLLSTTDPLERTREYAYGSDNTPTTITNARGQTITTGYDDAGRLNDLSSGLDLSQQFAYDNAGHLSEVTDETGTTTFSYNTRGLLTGVDQPGDDDYSYEYTPTGAIASRTYPSGATITYSYDADGRMLSQERGNRTTAYDWDLDGHQTQTTYPSQVGKTQTRTIDRTGRTSSITTTDDTTPPAPLLDIDYERNELGAPTAITRTRGTGTPVEESFTYNVRDSLTRWCPSTPTCTPTTPDRVDYNYDNVGNQTQVTGNGDVPDPGTISMTYDNADQRTTTTRTGGTNPGTTSHTWDADGNLTSAERQYDPLGQLTAAQNADGDPVSYTYNALGQRRTITTGTQDPLNWSWDINAPLARLAETRPGNGATTVHDYTATGSVLSSTNTGSSASEQWYAHDALGSVTDTYTATGDPARQITYDPWGDTLTNIEATPNAPQTPFGYTSAPLDPGTGNWHLRARDYDPSWRSFTNPDPAPAAADDPGITTYHYAVNQPLLYIDPSGRSACGIFDFACDVADDFSDSAEDFVEAQVYLATHLGAGTIDGTLQLTDLIYACTSRLRTQTCPDYLNGQGPNYGEEASDMINEYLGVDTDSFCYKVGEFFGIPIGGGAAAGGKLTASGLRALVRRLTKALGPRGGAKAAGEVLPGVARGWPERVAENGKGRVWQQPGAIGNAHSVRVMESTDRYPNGYVRFYNEHGQPIGLNGKPGPSSETHIPRDPDGSFEIPEGW